MDILSIQRYNKNDSNPYDGYYIFRMRFGFMDVSAAMESVIVVGFNEKTIRIWRNEYYQYHGDFTASGSGKHSCPYVLDDENCRKKLSWLLS